jgi:hypothetical protein
MSLQNISRDYAIGDPVKTINGPIYGRIAGWEGTEFQGRLSIALIVTPHGSTYRVGRAWFLPIEEGTEDMAKLEEYDADAWARLAAGGRIRDIHNKPVRVA